MDRKGGGIFTKSLKTFASIGGAISIPFLTQNYIIEVTGLTKRVIFLGWFIFYLLILLLYASYAYYNQHKNYFAYTLKIFKSISLLIILPIALVVGSILNIIIGLFYLKYLRQIVNQNQKTGVRAVEEKMFTTIKNSYKEIFIAPTENINKPLKKNKKGQFGHYLFIALLLALVVILFTIIFLYVNPS